MRFSLITLGCDKNTVDSERILGTLVENGAEPVEDPARAEVLIVNTCAFIDAAKEESIETLLEAARLKEEGQARALIAVGCLVERYRAELAASLPEVDLFIGLRDLPDLIPQLVMRGLLDVRLKKHPGARLPIGGARHTSYLKVSEGCDHKCAFCAIPIWRGRHRSFELDALVQEASALEARGVVELNLVAQDLAHYGRDLERSIRIHDLLAHLLKETSIPWFRLLYIYSAGLREPLIELMASEDRLLSYIDMPIQHASDRMLQLMRRPERAERLREKIGWLRSLVPELTLRTTVVVGFPGETEEDFEALLGFIEEIGFDHLGAFAYSPQPGTVGADMPDQVPEALKMERLALVSERQRDIVAARNQALLGRRLELLIDRVEAEADGEPVIEARRRGQALEVDGVTHVDLAECAVEPGDLVSATITGADDSDLWATVHEVTRAAPAAADRRRPAALSLDSAWGR